MYVVLHSNPRAWPHQWDNEVLILTLIWIVTMDVTPENIGCFGLYYIGNSNTMHNFGDGDAGFQNGKELLIKFFII